MGVREVLVSLGFNPSDFGDYYRMRPIYRASDNNTSLSVHKRTGKWTDFGLDKKGDLAELVKICLNLSNIEEAEGYLGNNFQTQRESLVIKSRQTFDKDIVTSLKPIYGYWEGRGISSMTLKLFQGGLCGFGRMRNRFVFPIFDSKGTVIGFCGRDITDKSKIKWKILGQKNNFLYPLNVNEQEIIKAKKIVIVESIGDMLRLWELGVKFSMVLFGVSLSIAQLNKLIQLDPDEVLIGLNNEPTNNNIGNFAAEKIKRILLRHFDRKQVRVTLPIQKDFGIMNYPEIVEWKQIYNV